MNELVNARLVKSEFNSLSSPGDASSCVLSCASSGRQRKRFGYLASDVKRSSYMYIIIHVPANVEQMLQSSEPTGT